MGLISSVRKAIHKGEKTIHPSWMLDLKDKVLNAPKISTYDNGIEEVILIGTQEGKLHQMKTNGEHMWTFSAGSSLSDEEAMFVDSETINSINTIPLVETFSNSKVILFGTESGDLFCLSTTGKELWKANTKSAIRGSPIFSNFKNKEKQIIVGSNDGNIYIFSTDGSLKEVIDVESPIENSPLHENNLLIVGTKDGEVVAINEEGEIAWKFKTGDRITANITSATLNKADEHLLLVPSQDNNLYAIGFDGEVRWVFRTEGAIISEVAIQDINNDNQLEVIFGSCDNKVYCIDSNGELIWSYETDFWIASTPIVADIDDDGALEVVAGSYDHKIYVLDSQGDYKLDFIPGLGGVINQSGHYSNTMHSEVGKNKGKLFTSFSLEGNIVGCAKSRSGNIIANTKQGKVYNIRVN